MIITKKIKNRIQIIVGALVLVALITLCAVSSARRGKIAKLRNELKQTECLVDSLKNRCKQLENMEALSITTVFEVKNINALGVQKVGDISQLAKIYTEYTRSYVLDSVMAKK